MIVVGIDPGTRDSALAAYDGTRVVGHFTFPNDIMLDRLRHDTVDAGTVLAIEGIASYGMAVGAEVFATVLYSGRFIEAWDAQKRPWCQLFRKEIKLHLCASNRATDANIRQALYDRFGPGKEKAVGLKKSPGPLYGVKGHEMAALAVAVTWWDTMREGRESSPAPTARPALAAGLF